MSSSLRTNDDHSGKTRAGLRRRWLGVTPVAMLLGVSLSACGASNTQLARSARRVPIAHIAELPEKERPTALASLPVVLEIRKGDRFPIDAALDSRLLTLHDTGPWTLEAKQTFYVLLREDGPPVISEDGLDFDSKPRNSFSVGFGAMKGKRATVKMLLGFHKEGSPGD